MYRAGLVAAHALHKLLCSSTHTKRRSGEIAKGTRIYIKNNIYVYINIRI